MNDSLRLRLPHDTSGVRTTEHRNGRQGRQATSHRTLVSPTPG